MIVDTILFDMLFMCQLEKANGIKKTLVVQQKRLKEIKLENGHLLYPLFLAEAIYVLHRI